MNDDRIIQDNSMDVKDMMSTRQNQINQKKMDEYKHGDYVPGENGEAGGILIDDNEVMRKATEVPQMETIRKYISNQTDQINRIKNGEDPSSVMNDDSYTTDQDGVDKVGANDKPDLKKVQDAFAKYDLGFNGLVPSGSEEAKRYAKKMEDLHSGKVNLDDFANKPSNISQNNNAPDVPHHESQPTTNTNDDNQRIIQFDVPSDNVSNFISTLSKSDRDKIQKSNTIIVNELKTLNIPTTTRTITSMDEYKRIAPRSIYSDVVECVLPNSGYVATVRGCGSLAMASIIPDSPNSQPDLNKRFQFCYDNLVTTSIGKLSLQEFMNHTSINDLNVLLFNILRASESDDQSVTLVCGADSCHKEYDVKYKMSELLDTDSISDELNQQINKVVTARDVIKEAEKVHNESPVMTCKYIEIQTPDKTLVIGLKATDATTAIERYPLIASLSKQYSRYIVGLLMYIPKIYLTFKMTNEETPNTYEIDDATIIAENLGEMTDDSIQAMFKIIQTLQEFSDMTYSFKGTYKCPHCGRVETRVPCDVDNLIFFKVQKAMQ